MSHDCCVAPPHDAMRLSAVGYCGFPDHTHLMFLVVFVSSLPHQPIYSIASVFRLSYVCLICLCSTVSYGWHHVLVFGM